MEDELTLMDAFRVLARRWKLIVAVTLVPTVAVTTLLLFALTPAYTSTARVAVAQQGVVPQGIAQLATLAAAQPIATPATYVSMAQAPGLYQQIIEQLQLSGEPGHMTASTLAQAVKVSSVKDTNIIAIEVKLGDKDQAAAVANAVADHLIEHAKGAAVAEQMSTYRAYLHPLLVDIEVQQTALEAKRAALAGIPKVLTTTKSIVNDQTLLDVAEATSSQSVLELGRLSMVSQEVNPLWISLTSDITSMTADIATKTGLKALCERMIGQLEAPSLGNDTQSPIRIEQRAIPADERDATGRGSKVAVTFVAALLLGVLLAFLVDYVQTARAAEATARRGKES
jgi:capsular polysaccharide biosynthesis protein